MLPVKQTWLSKFESYEILKFKGEQIAVCVILKLTACFFFFYRKKNSMSLNSIRKYSFKSLSKAIFCITNQRVLFGPPSSISICLSFLPRSCVILSSVSFLLPLARQRSPVLSVFCLKVGRLIVQSWWRPATLLHRVLCWQPPEDCFCSDGPNPNQLFVCEVPAYEFIFPGTPLIIVSFSSVCVCLVSDRFRLGGEQWWNGLLRLLNHCGLSGISSGEHLIPVIF